MRFLFHVCFLGVFLLSGMFACSGGSTTCKDNNGCISGQVCCIESGKQEGTCVAKDSCKAKTCETACQGQSDCSNNQTCTNGCCAAKSCTGTPCQSNTDCTNKQACQNNCCVDNSTKSCSKADDCPDKQECVGATGSGVCQACAKTCESSLDCSGNGITCYRGCCRVAPCTNDDGCKTSAGKPYCDTKTGSCVTCTENKHCQEIRTICDTASFTCKKVECTDGADCPNAKPICNKETFKCVEKPVCIEDADCTDIQLNRCDPKADNGKGICKKGHCVPCTSDDECGRSNDYCISTSQGLKDGRKCLKGCEKNADCPTGYDCEEKVGEKFIVGKGIFVCFPRIQFCEDPCATKKCDPNTEFCNLAKGGICELKPVPCKSCSIDDECNEAGKTGNKCLQLGGGNFCGKTCSTKSECPTNQKSSNGNTREFECVGGQCTALDSCK